MLLHYYDEPRSTGQNLLAVVQAAYHLGEILPLRDALAVHGYNLVVAMPEPRHDLLSRFRASTRRAKQTHDALIAQGFVTNDDDAEEDLAGLIVMNDWGVPRDLVLDAKSKKIPTFGIVEGVQDFNDDDIERNRRPYRTVDLALCKGQDDFDELAGANREIIGNSRLQKLLQGPTASGTRAATVNCNFSYGVLSSQRQPWLQSVRQGCALAKIDYVVSKHPGDHGWVNPMKLSKTPISELIERNDILISRFSTVILEALSIGTRVIYHNPHGEKVTTFQDSQSGFLITSSAHELAKALEPDEQSPAQRRQTALDFLSYNVDVDDSATPAERAAQAIVQAVS